ncbi:MAG: hypothetical protein ACLFP4_03355 [Spirochaetales bacterium]
MRSSQYAAVCAASVDKAPASVDRAVAPITERESHRFARTVLQTLDFPEARHAPVAIRELGMQAIDSLLSDAASARSGGSVISELDTARVGLLRHIARLDELRLEHSQRLRAVEIQIAALQQAICRVPIISDGFGATPALSNAVERLGNLLVSQSILKKIGPQISLALHTHESVVAQIECAMQAADVA